MPDLLSIRQISLQFSDLDRRSPIIRPDRPPSRAPGVHQSDILTHIAYKIGKLKPGERLEDDYPWRMAMGNMWEEFYFSLRPDYQWQPGQLTVDGVSVNADGLGLWQFNNGGGMEAEAALIDTKCTEKKVKETLEDWLGEWVY